MSKQTAHTGLPIIVAVLVFATGFGLGVSPVAAQPVTQVQKDTWRFGVAPYYWLSSVQGATDLGQPPDPIQAGNYVFGVGTGHLAPGFLVSGLVGKGRFDLDVDVAATSVSDSAMIQLADMPQDSIPGYYDVNWSEATFRVNYRIGPYLSPYVRAYVGLRWMKWTTDLTDDATASLGSWDETWIDPVVGANTRFSLGAGFSGVAHVDAAGFGVGSKLSWTVSGGLSYHVAGPLHVNGRYIYKEVSYDNDETGEDLFIWKDGVAQGWFFGATVAFPATSK